MEPGQYELEALITDSDTGKTRWRTETTGSLEDVLVDFFNLQIHPDHGQSDLRIVWRPRHGAH